MPESLHIATEQGIKRTGFTQKTEKSYGTLARSATQLRTQNKKRLAASQKMARHRHPLRTIYRIISTLFTSTASSLGVIFYDDPIQRRH
jgi:hypothetical protein